MTDHPPHRTPGHRPHGHQPEPTAAPPTAPPLADGAVGGTRITPGAIGTGTADPADPLYVHRLIVAALEKFGLSAAQAEQYATAHQHPAAGTEDTEHTRRQLRAAIDAARRDLDTAEDQAAAHAGKHDPQGYAFRAGWLTNALVALIGAVEPYAAPAGAGDQQEQQP
ncbi:MAG TPA: hypothetical protein VK545_22815 [Streptomyces sp.]|nr:hypothetical protein [Streptomyces sp.]